MQLRPYQDNAVQSLFDYFNDPVRAHTLEPANPLVCMPTGTGKSLVIADFTRRALLTYQGTRVIMTTHVKELIKQNAAKLQELWPLAPLGVYSAGLKSRDTIQPIIYSGIKSVVGKFPLLGRRDLLLIDEAHLLSPSADTGYQDFIAELKNGVSGMSADLIHHTNPYLRVVGFTATPYRTGLGLMTNGNIFTDIVYNDCNVAGFTRLIADGFLCPLIPKRTHTEFDLSKVGMQNGEFNQTQMQAAVDKETITYAALEEFVAWGRERHSWLIFASGVEHAKHITEMLNTAFGITAVAIHSKQSDTENDRNLALWKAGKARCAVNMNALTTGVDHPPCDYIGMFRGTMSTGLWVQMLGRGMRPYRNTDPAFPYTKTNCLVLDFAGNARRLGPVDDPVIPRAKGKGAPGDAPLKQCKQCGAYASLRATHCILCGTEFPTSEPNINRTAGTEELLRSDLPQIERFKVDRMVIVPHTSKSSGQKSIKVCYYCGLRTFYEWYSFESQSALFLHKSHEFFRRSYHYQDTNYTWESDVPKTNAEVLALGAQLRAPTTLQIWINREHPRIEGYEY